MMRCIAELLYYWYGVARMRTITEGVYYRTQWYTCITREFKGKRKNERKRAREKWEGKRKHSMPIQKRQERGE
jgi:hypothetical protein